MRAMVLAAASAVRPRNRDDRRRDRQRNQPGRLTPITDEKNRHPVCEALLRRHGISAQSGRDPGAAAHHCVLPSARDDGSLIQAVGISPRQRRRNSGTSGSQRSSARTRCWPIAADNRAKTSS